MQQPTQVYDSLPNYHPTSHFMESCQLVLSGSLQGDLKDDKNGQHVSMNYLILRTPLMQLPGV